MQLTIRKWLDIGLTADEKINLKAAMLHNQYLDRYWDEIEVEYFSAAVTQAMTWSSTPQGHGYWSVIHGQNRQPQLPSVQQETIQQTNMSTNLTQIQGRSIVTLWNGHLALEDNCTAVITRVSRDTYCLTDELDDHGFSQCTIGCREGDWMHNDLLVNSDYSSNLIWVDDDDLNTTYDGNKFHADEADTHSIVWCESDSEWAHQDDCEYGWVDRRNEGYFIRDNNEYCHSSRDDVYFMNSNVMHDRDYLWCERLNDYVHCDDYISDDDDDDDDCVRGYHHFSRVNAYERDTPKWTIGFEIEKEDRVAKTLNDANDIYSAMKWCHESDGSLDSHSGFELVSPVFDMYDQDMISKHFNHPYIKPLINAAFNHESCGGHINIASTMYTPSQLADGLSAFFPLLYSMYESRITKNYSKAKQKHQYFSSADKYSSVYIKSNVVELRIFPAVRNVDNLQWRLDLVRIMVENINKSEIDVLRMMLNPRTRLHKLLAKVFTPEKIFEKSNLYIKYSEMYNGRKLSMPKKKK
jgi:hypothetical protein